MKRLLCEEGVNIILDRYTYSGVAYSAAKGMSVEWCIEPDRGLVKPDTVLFLELSVKAALARISDGTNERYETQAFLEKVKNVYDTKLYDEKLWTKVDATQKREEITSPLYEKILSVIESRKEAPLECI